MSTSCKSNSIRQPVLPANVPRMLAELRELAAANGRPPVADRPIRAGAPILVLRGK